MSESASKKGFGSRLWSLVAEEVPEGPQATPAATAPAPVPVAPMAVSIPTPVAVVDPAIQATLEADLNTAAPEGYREIVNDLVTLAEDITDERARYRAAVRMAGKKGHSLLDLLGDLDKCLGILEAKNTEFAAEVKRQIETKVGARRSAIATREAEITAKTELMGRLQQEIAQLQHDNLLESEQISTETAKITGVGNNFRLAYQAVLANIQSIRNKISTYGEGVK